MASGVVCGPLWVIMLCQRGGPPGTCREQLYPSLSLCLFSCATRCIADFYGRECSLTADEASARTRVQELVLENLGAVAVDAAVRGTLHVFLLGTLHVLMLALCVLLVCGRALAVPLVCVCPVRSVLRLLLLP